MSIPRNTYKDSRQNAENARDNAGAVQGYVSEETNRVLAVPGDDDAPYAIAHGRASRDGQTGLVEERDGAAQRIAVDEFGRVWTRLVGDVQIDLPGPIDVNVPQPLTVDGTVNADARLDVGSIFSTNPPPYPLGPAQVPRPQADRRGFAFTVPAGGIDVDILDDPQPRILYEADLPTLDGLGTNWTAPGSSGLGFFSNIRCPMRRAHTYVLAEGQTISPSPTQHALLELKPFISPYPQPTLVSPPSDAWFSPGIFEPLYALDVPGSSAGFATQVYNVSTAANILPREAQIEYRESRFRIPLDPPVAGQFYRLHVAMPPIDISGAQAITWCFRFLGFALSGIYSNFRLRILMVLSV